MSNDKNYLRPSDITTPVVAYISSTAILCPSAMRKLSLPKPETVQKSVLHIVWFNAFCCVVEKSRFVTLLDFDVRDEYVDQSDVVNEIYQLNRGGERRVCTVIPWEMTNRRKRLLPFDSCLVMAPSGRIAEIHDSLITICDDIGAAERC